MNEAMSTAEDARAASELAVNDHGYEVCKEVMKRSRNRKRWLVTWTNAGARALLRDRGFSVYSIYKLTFVRW